jgi:hypothetical protein
VKEYQFQAAFFSLVCALGITSCTTMLNGLYGIKKMERVDEKTILQYSKKYNIPTSDSYELDTTYITFITSLDTIHYKTQIKNHYRPLQVLYFDATGQLISFQINCYAGGFPNLNWNKNGIMTVFPPQQQAHLDNILSLKAQLEYLRPLPQTKTISSDSLDYIVVVYWNKFINRQSKRLIAFVQNNSILARDKKIKILYANDDNIFAIQD